MQIEVKINAQGYDIEVDNAWENCHSMSWKETSTMDDTPAHEYEYY